MSQTTPENMPMDNAPQRPEVLVVDDDLFFSVRIETMLTRAGYAVHVTRSGEKACAYAVQHPTALAIVNYGSPRLDPGEVVRQLKMVSASLPVLCFMPHKQMPELRPQARAAGADLVVANSALTLRLPALAAKLAPLDGSPGSVQAAAPLVEDDMTENSIGQE